MLLLTLLLLVVAAVLLVLSVATTATAWAWASVAASALAAVVLAVRWWRLRRSVGPTGVGRSRQAPVPPDVAAPHDDAPAVVDRAPRDLPEQEPAPVSTAPRAERDPLAGDGGHPGAVEHVPDEPAGEAAPAVDVEVLVVDERPEYHRGDCPRADPQLAEALPRDEARALGFTPCPVCDPDDDGGDRAGEPRAAARADRARGGH